MRIQRWVAWVIGVALSAGCASTTEGGSIAREPPAAVVTDPAAPAAPTEPAPSPKPSHGWLSMHTEPAVEVILAGESLGRTPLSHVRLPPGEHRLELVDAEKGIRQTRSVVIAVGKETRLLLRLDRDPADAK